MKAIITLLKFLLLSDYPSGSAINYYNDQLYVIGDDASNLLVLDSNYNKISTVPFFEYTEKRIPKAKKADLETAVILEINGQQHLLALGSAATRERERGVLLPLPFPGNDPSHITYTSFIERLQVPEINIEGSTLIGDRLILSNRGNGTNAVNHFIVTTPDFYEQQEDAPLHVLKLILPLTSFAGVSELCYVAQEDILLVLLSSEETANAYDDGVIGDSYIGWIQDVSQKLGGENVSLDGIVNLSEADPAFKGEKMEGVCVSAVTDNGWYLHLVSDNDQGASKLFHVKMLLK